MEEIDEFSDYVIVENEEATGRIKWSLLLFVRVLDEEFQNSQNRISQNLKDFLAKFDDLSNEEILDRWTETIDQFKPELSKMLKEEEKSVRSGPNFICSIGYYITMIAPSLPKWVVEKNVSMVIFYFAACSVLFVFFYVLYIERKFREKGRRLRNLLSILGSLTLDQ